MSEPAPTMWISWKSVWVVKLHFQKLKIKTMLIRVFDSKVSVHQKFVPSGETVNAQFYLDVLDRLCKQIARARPET